MPFTLDPRQLGILVIDMQEKLIPVIHEGEKVVEQARKIMELGRLLNIPILATEQLPKKLGPTVPVLKSLANWPVALPKATFSAVSVLPEDLPKRILIVGVETHICVRQTVFDLLGQDLQPIVLADAVGSRRLLDHEVTLQELRMIGVPVSTAEAMAFDTLRSASHPRFREALALFK